MTGWQQCCLENETGERMGTVGLNFGSPTSGQGFDVTSTVNSIVSNLQKVETPWKTQLTALQSQDTQISNLGTLLSTLSTDVSNLTDFTGVLAQKTGSSSDTSVLELTSATSSAAAGTHQVTVNSLATTSSGYLTEVASASDALTGSLWLGVGSGTLYQVSVPQGGNLQSLASAINSAGIGISASVLTDTTGSRLSLVSATSGAGGNIVIGSSSNLADASGTVLGYSGTAGSGSSNSNGTLASVSAAGDRLTGSITIQVGGGGAQTVSLGSSGGTVQDLAQAINNTSGMGVTATVSTDGKSLLLQSTTRGSAGNIAVKSKIVDTGATLLGYTSTVSGTDASLNVDGVNLTSASNIVSNLIQGVTFQLLAPSATDTNGNAVPVQVVIGNDNSGVESSINTMVNDYNALIKAINTQEGNDSSGKPEPLFGSPTLSLLQQQMMSSLNLQNPNGYIDAVQSTGTTLSGSVTIQAGNGPLQTFTIGPGTNGINTFFTGSGSDANTLTGLLDAINAANAGSTVAYTGTDGSGGSNSSGTMNVSSNATLSGSFTVQAGNGTTETIQIGTAPNPPAANTIYTGSDGDADTLAGVAAAINADSSLGFTAGVTTINGISTLTLTSGTSGTAGMLTVNSSLTSSGSGISAGITTRNGQTTLTLLSQRSGSSGALVVNSSLKALTDQALTYTGKAGADATSTAAATTSSGSLTGISDPDQDTLSGSLSIQVGTGASETILLGSGTTLADGTTPVNTLTALKEYINQNSASLGVTADIATNSGGTYSLTLSSNTAGSAGTLSVTSNVSNTGSTSSTNLNYNNSSDITGLTSLGISMNNDGTISLDVSALDSAINSDYNSVLGFFQYANSWGVNVSNILNQTGTGSSSGILSLAQKANSTMESTLNSEISKEDALIADQQKRLTDELNQANQILQQLPSQLNGMNMMYSAISGYNTQKG